MTSSPRDDQFGVHTGQHLAVHVDDIRRLKGWYLGLPTSSYSQDTIKEYGRYDRHKLYGLDLVTIDRVVVQYREIVRRKGFCHPRLKLRKDVPRGCMVFPTRMTSPKLTVGFEIGLIVGPNLSFVRHLV